MNHDAFLNLLAHEYWAQTLVAGVLVSLEQLQKLDAHPCFDIFQPRLSLRSSAIGFMIGLRLACWL